jgi:uncharacterized SAM-binding protein YcdF (DUF218 family)
MKTIALAIAWMLIAVPLGWGVYQSVQKSMPLFEGQSEPALPSTKRVSHVVASGGQETSAAGISG